jgi:hypothetical protein
VGVVLRSLLADRMMVVFMYVAASPASKLRGAVVANRKHFYKFHSEQSFQSLSYEFSAWKMCEGLHLEGD